MINEIRNKLKREWHLRVLQEDPMDYKISLMRKAGYVIGKNCKLYSSLGTPEPYLVQIGNNVTISFGVTVITHDNSPIKIIHGMTDVVGKVVVGDNCFIGANCLLLPGVWIADHTVVAAGSVVTKSVREAGKILGGNPAKVIGTWDDFKRKNEEYCFNFDGMSFEEKKKLILDNENKLVLRDFL